ncbi:MAG: rhodanese-like domain-containing protein [Oscillospiraceae bacterium]|nr:rhodanese-like domain-containing protein [Oscillospiraceae bacterium]
MKKTLFIIGLLSLLAACSSDSIGEGNLQPRWTTISGTEAREIMATSDNYIVLDVRTHAEFEERRIDGAILIPYDEIKSRAETELPDKNAVILLYCRSGRRSAVAASELVALGYTDVYDFGGILDWVYETIGG